MTAIALVVAAEATRREAIVGKLTPSFRAIQAEGGLDGLKRLEDSRADCVVISVDISDVPMVGFIDRVKAEDPTVPVLVVGQTANPELTARMLRAGAFEHVSTPDQLLDCAERAVTQRRAEAALDRHRRLARVLRGISQDVTEGVPRAAVERVVFDRLGAVDLYQVICVGEYSPADGELTVHLPVEATFPAATTELLCGVGDDHILNRAVESGEVTVAANPAVARRASVATPPAPPATKLRTAAIPFTHAGSVHGVALVSTQRGGAFDASERALLGELGTIVGSALWRADGEDQRQQPVFIENLVHELRNPLGIALAHLELGRESDDPAALDRVKAALRQIEDLVENISKLPPFGSVDATDTRDLEKSVSAAWASLDGPDAELVIEETGPVAADHALLERLLSNLFRNAVDHGGDDVTVRVGLTDDGFFVEDDGPGIDESERDRVFDRSYSSGDGAGIGLNLVADIVDVHGWSVQLVESGAGGARFEISGVEFEDDGEPTGG